MNNHPLKPIPRQMPTPEVKQLTASLICTFRLDEHCQNIMNTPPAKSGGFRLRLKAGHFA